MLAGENGKRFKSIRETYKINTLLLTMALMYPNKTYDEKRTKLIICVFLSVIPAFTFVGKDMRLRILHNDMPNLVRQSIVTVSMIFVLVKLILTILRKNELRALFEKIDDDYELFNDMPEEYQNIVKDTIQKTKRIEKGWFIIMGITALSYPVLAGVCTMYSQIFSENPKRFMVHETAVIFLTEEQKYESPYFELINVYIIYIVIILLIGFVGFDGMFSVCMLHISLKLKIYNKKLKNIFMNVGDNIKIKTNIAAFVINHCETERLMGEVQKCFEVWLVGIFLNAILQLGMTLTQFTNQTVLLDNVGLVKGIDKRFLRLSTAEIHLVYTLHNVIIKMIGLLQTEIDINQVYFLFALATLVHIYVPCYLASEVTANAAEVANVAYSCSWEQIQDVGIRKSICIIITKAQTPICLKALGMLTFNMEMFLSILQTAYSMYTLLRK